MYIYQEFYNLANTLANTNGLLASNLYHLVYTLIYINDMLKVNLYYLASILANTDNKTDNFIKKRSVISNYSHLITN